MCPKCQSSRKKIIKCGFYKSKSARNKKVQKYFCNHCLNYFSAKTGQLTYKDKKPKVTYALIKLLSAGVSQRECARQLNVCRKTVDQKIKKLGEYARKKNKINLRGRIIHENIVFDEMETFEHSKMKQLSITVAVVEKTREIICLDAAQMPTKGLLAARSRKKYGRRKDHRPESLRRVLRQIKSIRGKLSILKSDLSPRYPKYVKEILPGVQHIQYKGKRGCVVGQGELKAAAFDPIFSLNHTCAMIRDLIKRLARKTWCTTKKICRLQDLLDIYMFSHNRRLKRLKDRRQKARSQPQMFRPV